MSKRINIEVTLLGEPRGEIFIIRNILVRELLIGIRSNDFVVVEDQSGNERKIRISEIRAIISQRLCSWSAITPTIQRWLKEKYI